MIVSWLIDCFRCQTLISVQPSWWWTQSAVGGRHQGPNGTAAEAFCFFVFVTGTKNAVRNAGLSIRKVLQFVFEVKRGFYLFTSQHERQHVGLIPADITVTGQKAKPRRGDSGKELKLSNLLLHVCRLLQEDWILIYLFKFEVHFEVWSE